MSRFKNFVVWKKITAFLATLFLTGIAVFSAIILIFARDLPSRDQIINREVSQSTKIYDRAGEILLYEISTGGKRTVIPLDQIPKFIKDGTIAMEDEGFYDGGPISWRGILRATSVNLRDGKIVQGGSTITQQLAKKAFLSDERTWSRKIKELLLAIRLNSEYGKDEILALYLNEVPYGPTSYGIESASHAYFGKSAVDLTLAEGAILASLPRAPSYYSPWGNHVDELLARQKLVLNKLRKLGKISEQELDAAFAQKIVFQPREERGIKAPHFVIAVQDYLVQKYGEDMVRKGGLKVITTLDWNMQEIAERAVSEGAARNEELYGGKNAALLAQDPKTGQVLAMVGSRNYFDLENQGNFNVATQGLRQPGSALKPFVYLSAFEKGYVPETVIFDVPTEFSKHKSCPLMPNYEDENRDCFHPKNFDGKTRGPVSMQNALAQSLNIPAVKVLYLTGVLDAVNIAQRFGLKTLDNPGRYGLSLVLGGGAIRLSDLVGAYSALADDGRLHEQNIILEVRSPHDSVLESFRDKSEIVANEYYVRMINDILTDVPAREALYGRTTSLTIFPGHDMALKTGTSQDYRDAWAFGYVPNLAVGVWAGNNDNTPMHKKGSSVLAAIPIWNDFLSDITKTLPQETFQNAEYVLPDKPVLRGEYATNGEINTILYYINRIDPLGNPPLNPSDDPQFDNWEFGVKNWAVRFYVPQKDRLENLTEQYSTPVIRIIKPKFGESIKNNVLNIKSEISTNTYINKINIYFNDFLFKDFTGNFGPVYEFNYSYEPYNVKSQNLLEIEVFDSRGVSSRSGIIINQ